MDQVTGKKAQTDSASLLGLESESESTFEENEHMAQIEGAAQQNVLPKHKNFLSRSLAASHA
jgi:hypothetical protein